MKYPIKEQEDIIKATARELKISEEKVKFVVKNFWLGVRYFLTHPLEAGGGLWIEQFLRFTIPVWAIKRVLPNLKEGSTQKEFYLKLLKQLDDGEE
jgi:hypothetical protein